MPESTESCPKRLRRRGVRKRGPAQSKLGRAGGQSKFDKTDTARLVADIAGGVPVEVACAAVGIHRDTFYQWLDSHPSFAQALAAEKQRVIVEALDAIKSCSTKDREFRHLSWFLETVYRDYFAPPDKGISFTQNNLVISEFDEARRILDAAKALPYRSERKE
jgi:transposase-like protein